MVDRRDVRYRTVRFGQQNSMLRRGASAGSSLIARCCTVMARRQISILHRADAEAALVHRPEHAAGRAGAAPEERLTLLIQYRVQAGRGPPGMEISCCPAASCFAPSH
jgi:hypothetical protein